MFLALLSLVSFEPPLGMGSRKVVVVEGQEQLVFEGKNIMRSVNLFPRSKAKTFGLFDFVNFSKLFEKWLKKNIVGK